MQFKIYSYKLKAFFIENEELFNNVISYLFLFQILSIYPLQSNSHDVFNLILYIDRSCMIASS